MLRHEEIEKDRIERLQRHDDGPGAEILAEVDGADAEMAGKRRAQEFLVEDRLLLGDLRLGVFQIGRVGVQGGLADRLDLELLEVALIGDLVQLRRRLQRFELGGVVVGAQLQQQRALFDIVSGIERDRIDDAGDFQRQVGPLHGAQTADRLDGRLPSLGAALVVETVCGGDFMELMNFLIMAPLNAWNPKIPPNTTATATSMITMRLIIV